MFTHIAEQLNDAGLDQRKVLAPGIEIPWEARSVKEQLWRRTQQYQVGKDSTTELTTKEIDKVFETLNRFLSESKGISIEMPSIETLINNQRIREE